MEQKPETKENEIKEVSTNETTQKNAVTEENISKDVTANPKKNDNTEKNSNSTKIETTKNFKPFYEKFGFKIIFVFFVIGSLLGTYWEEFLYFFTHGMNEWVCRDGTVIGPFSPIYGVGVCIFAAFLGKNNDSRTKLKTFLYSALIGGITEFMMSVVAEYIFGEVIWDYSDKFLNIMGRTTIPFMLFWGLGGLALMKLVYPLIEKFLKKIPYKYGQPVYIALLIFMVINLFLTYGSLGRQAIRSQGTPPSTFIGEFFDKYYTDEYLEKRFPAITFSK